ncbi:MAG: hypothetical protein SCH66_03185 [Methanolobus sp.]|nr:hypothetical protein [Methanolobus sp.]
MKLEKLIFPAIAIVLFLIFMIPVTCASISDAVGDFSSQDVDSLDVSTDGNNLNIVISCTDDVADYSFYGAVFVDADQNVLTGYADNGADYVYQFSYMSIIYSEPMITTTLNDNMIDASTLQAQGNMIYISLPLRQLGNDDGKADVFVAVHDQMVKALDFDRAPDYGAIDSQTGDLKVPLTAESRLQVSDRTGDSAAADIKGVDATVENGMLNILITYSNNVEPSAYSYGEDITGWIFIDADQNLATGFTNTEQAPPTFGVDYIIEYTVGSLTGTDAAIRMINTDSSLTKEGYTDTTTRSLGVPYNDGMLKVSGDQVLIRVPLVLLGNDDGSMYLTVDSFTIHDVLGGDMDSIPDNGNGAIDTSDGSVKALLGYGDDRTTFTDPASDSTGFGKDGDELVSIETGFAEDKMLITITYSSLSLDDGAITTISFDTNQDGKEDYSLAYNFMYGKLAATMIGNYGGEYSVKEVSHLVTMQGNKMYLSIPSTYLGNDDGNMDIDVETAPVVYGASIPHTDQSREWLSGEEVKNGIGQVHLNPDKFSRTLYDRAPDTGSYTIGAGTNYQPAAGNAILAQGAEEVQEEDSSGFSVVMGVIALLTCWLVLSSRKKQ